MLKNVTITRQDAINAEGGCIIAAVHYRKQSRLRKNAGPNMAHHRAWLRAMAKAQEAAARELRRGIDAADGTFAPCPSGAKVPIRRATMTTLD